MTDKSAGPLPCPFCGGPGRLDGQWAECADGTCHGSNVVMYLSEWNRRAQAPAPVPGSAPIKTNADEVSRASIKREWANLLTLIEGSPNRSDILGCVHVLRNAERMQALGEVQNRAFFATMEGAAEAAVALVSPVPGTTPSEAMIVAEVLARFTLEDAEWFEKEARSWDDSVMTIAIRDMQEAERTRQPIGAEAKKRFKIMQKKRDLLAGLGALLRATCTPETKV